VLLLGLGVGHFDGRFPRGGCRSGCWVAVATGCLVACVCVMVTRDWKAGFDHKLVCAVILGGSDLAKRCWCWRRSMSGDEGVSGRARCVRRLDCAVPGPRADRGSWTRGGYLFGKRESLKPSDASEDATLKTVCLLYTGDDANRN
jgi:hypothetical protein